MRSAQAATNIITSESAIANLIGHFAETVFFVCRILTVCLLSTYQTAFGHDEDLVSQKIQLFGIVASHNNNCPALSFFTHNCFYARNSRWVKRIDRLIQENEARMFHNGARNPQALLHAERVFAIRPLIIKVKTDTPKGFCYILIAGNPTQPSKQLQVLKP